MGTFAASLSRANKLASAYQRERDLSLHDQLTGLPNRRYLYVQLEKDFARAQRFKSPLSILMIDIDHFKEINDTYGHSPVGDEVLCKIVQAIKGTLRKNIDTLARYGGEEFVAILPETNGGEESAYEIAERCRDAVQNMTMKVDGKEIRLTISIGIAHYPEQKALSPDRLIGLADRALYQAKYGGRNRTVIFKKD